MVLNVCNIGEAMNKDFRECYKDLRLLVQIVPVRIGYSQMQVIVAETWCNALICVNYS